jgi:hypothetical protein
MKRKCKVSEESSSNGNIIFDEKETYNEDSTEKMKTWDLADEDNIINNNMKLLNGNRKRRRIINTCSEDSINENINNFGNTSTSFSWPKNNLNPILHHFETDAGIKENRNSNSTRFDVFSLFFSKELTSHIMEKTNIYVKYIIEKKQSNYNSPSAKIWKDILLSEMCRFFCDHVCGAKEKPFCKTILVNG